MNDKVVVKRWMMCLPLILLCLDGFANAAIYGIEKRPVMLLLSCAGMVIWGLVAFGFWNHPSMEEQAKKSEESSES